MPSQWNTTSINYITNSAESVVRDIITLIAHYHNITDNPLISLIFVVIQSLNTIDDVDLCIRNWLKLLKTHKILLFGVINSLLVTLDVTSLYTNISNEEGLRATFRKLLRDPTARKIRPHIMKLMMLVLSNTNFTFNGEHFLQVGGTSMGTGFAPSYANIFMAWLEEEAINNYPMKPLIWKRFIDDVFCIWTHGKMNLTDLWNILTNSMTLSSSPVKAVQTKSHF